MSKAFLNKTCTTFIGNLLNSNREGLTKLGDDNETSFFRYPPYPAPNGTEFNFNKRVWDGYEIFFKTRGGSSIASSRLLRPNYI